MSEKLSAKIRDVLADVCPAFEYIGGTTAIWHGCKCNAQTGDCPPCICVWHETDECIAGKWPQLAFVEEYNAAKTKSADLMLDETMAVIAEATKEGG